MAGAEPYLGKIYGDPFFDTGDRSKLLGFSLTDAHGGHYFPRPQNFLMRQGFSHTALILLKPSNPQSVKSSCPFPELLYAPLDDNEVTEDCAVSTQALRTILTGTLPPGDLQKSRQIRTMDEFFLPENRLGLQMVNERNTAREHMLFRRPFRRFKLGFNDDQQWRSAGFCAWFETLKPLPDSLNLDGNGFLGGDRRRVALQFEPLTEQPLAEIRDAVVQSATDSKGFLIYLVTPAVREATWPIIAHQHPIAAAIGKPLYCSGWNVLDNRPRPMLTLIPAGSVFFYSWPEMCERETLIRQQWLDCVSNEFGSAGFGRYLMGVWR